MTTYDFLKGQVSWAEGVLSAPAVTYPNGRNSHEVAGELIEGYRTELEDYELEHGRWYADGTFAGINA